MYLPTITILIIFTIPISVQVATAFLFLHLHTFLAILSSKSSSINKDANEATRGGSKIVQRIAQRSIFIFSLIAFIVLPGL